MPPPSLLLTVLNQTRKSFNNIFITRRTHPAIAIHRYFSSSPIASIKLPLPNTISSILSSPPQASESVTIHGWIRTVRSQKRISFAEVSDGTRLEGMQCVFNHISDENSHTVVNRDDVKKLYTGTAVSVTGKLIDSVGNNQAKELLVEKFEVIGECDPKEYPLQKKKHSVEFLRDNSHLRVRSKMTNAVLRVRNQGVVGFHDFFQKNEFIHVHTPILTSSDCEGAGEVFKVIPKSYFADSDSSNAANPASSDNNSINPGSDEPIPTLKPSLKEFFSHPAYLTVSGQLHAEIVAHSHPRVYTLSPSFRAETTLSTKHLSEFYMLEAEISFLNSLDSLLDVTEASIKHATSHLTNTCASDLSYFDSQFPDKHLLKRISTLIDTPFDRISYTDAINILLKAETGGSVGSSAKMNWKFPVKWGISLQSEHEKYLVDTVFKKPVFITRYPESVKPFYMLPSSSSPSPTSSSTVESYDFLLPSIGELVGGSLRQHSYSLLRQKLKSMGMNENEYKWYLDLRKYGSIPHGGFGLGLDRWLVFVTGQESVRDTVLCGRYWGKCDL
ncbi:hypothetical protein BKA69DRAFT_1086588 [Paraphysoderma sedebokerense]|nr:hypothetical protein BKA69DRAFT_1086588 [Paraphysoderma sedebokerense]